MAHTGRYTVQLQARVIDIFLMLSLLLSLGACSSHPRYYPFPSDRYSSSLGGYFDYQIDESTYLITYQFRRTTSLDDNELEVPQKYALYRAGELAKSKGAKLLLILHRDDWNLISGTTGKRHGRNTIRAGAGIIIRLLRDYPSLIQPHDDRIYEVDKLLQSLSESNMELAAYEGKISRDASVEKISGSFRRWRSSVGAYDSVPMPQVTRMKILGTEVKEFEPGVSITPQPQSGEFEVAIWDDKLISPFQFLSQCIKLADQEGYEVFKLVNWMVAEYRFEHVFDSWATAWFRTTARVVLQHRKEPDSLNPVFVVDEIKSKVNNIPDHLSRMWRH